MRRQDIAEAAVALIDREGLRGLTHRAIDRELGLPQGSTSYYARTRRDLIALVVEHLAAGTAAAVGRPPAPPASTAEAADRMAGLLEGLAPAGARARFALTLAVVHDADLHALLTTRSPVRERLLAGARATLEALGIADAPARAVDLVALTNGLLYDRLAGAGAAGDPADVRAILTAWLDGLPRA